MPEQIKDGDIVQIHYSKRLENGRVIQSTKGHSPAQFTIGGGDLPAEVEQTIKGMNIGQTANVKVEPKNAYGEFKKELLAKVEKNKLPEEIECKPGNKLALKKKDGDDVPLTIRKVEGEKVYVDANHPLAGKTILYNIQLLGCLGA